MGSYGHNRGLSQTQSFALGTHSGIATNAPPSAASTAAKPAAPQRAAPKKPDPVVAELTDQERAAIVYVISLRSRLALITDFVCAFAVG
jgi:hypothetical protein